MRLESLCLRHVRKFANELRLEFGEGLNIIAGPNEAGKSTIARAIQAAFFEASTTSRVQDLLSASSSSDSPEIELVFYWGGKKYELFKRFLRNKTCILKEGGRLLRGDLAEAELSKIWRLQQSNKKQLNGIPGLLWVTQGMAHELKDALDNAASSLEEVISTHFQSLGGEIGRRIYKDICEELYSLVTPVRRDPKGLYKEAIEQLEKREAQLSLLKERVDAYHGSIKKLDLLKKKKDDRVTEFSALKSRHEDIEKQLKESEFRFEDLKSAEKERKAVEQEIVQAQSLLQTIEGVEKKRDEDIKESQKLRDKLIAAQEKRRSLAAELLRAKEQAQEAKEKEQRVKAVLRKKELLDQRAERLARIERIDEKIRRLRELKTALESLQEERAKIRIGNESIELLKSLKSRLFELDLKINALSARLHFEIEENASVEFEGKKLNGKGTIHVQKSSTLVIPGIGRFVFELGAQIDELQSEKLKLEQERDRVLSIHSLSSVEEALEEFERKKRLENELKQLEGELRGLAPQGMDVLEKEKTQELARLSAIDAELKEKEEDPSFCEEVGPEEALAAENARNEAEGRVRLLEAEERKLSEEIAQLQARLYSLEESIAHGQRLLEEHARAGKTPAFLRVSIESLRLRLAELERRSASINAERERLESLRVLWKASSEKLDKCQREISNLSLEIAQLNGTLEAQSASGLERELEEAQANFERAQLQCTAIKERVEALKHLVDAFEAVQKEHRERWAEPVMRRLEHHYLPALFPNARIHHQLLFPEQLERDSIRLGFWQLSRGTQDQLGLLVRLAYADVLREAGYPTLLIFDDVFANSDLLRVSHFKTLICDAATRHQVLLLTCRPEELKGWGVIRYLP
ncbi:MAG: AAA family ATPase [Sandaracinaceae bacterium]|nr:AAA family ATPase [Sandaracinaceae bacterium]